MGYPNVTANKTSKTLQHYLELIIFKYYNKIDNQPY